MSYINPVWERAGNHGPYRVVCSEFSSPEFNATLATEKTTVVSDQYQEVVDRLSHIEIACLENQAMASLQWVGPGSSVTQMRV